MKILHMARSTVANAPIHINNFLNKYSKGKIENRCITSIKGIPTDKQDINWGWSNKVIQENLSQFEQMIEWCDIIHIHNQPPLMSNSTGWRLLENTRKPIVLQVHSEPEKIKPIYDVLTSHFPIAKILVIAQYQAVHMFQKDFSVIRNAVDINDIDLQPQYNDNKIPHVTFSPSNKASLERLESKWKSTWAYKSFYEVEPILKRLANEGIITYEIFYDVPFRKSLVARKKGDIHIDDIYTGSYHLSSLEGLAQGKMVICNIKPWMSLFLRQFLGKDTLPWIVADKDSLEKTLRYYCHSNNMIELSKLRHYSYEWIQKHWNPELVCGDYLTVYNEVLE